MQVILEIPVHTEMEDIMVWHYDPHGQFLVRSVYKLCRAKWSRDNRSRVSTESGKQENDSLWQRYGRNVALTRWSISRGSVHDKLMLRMNLQRRGMKIYAKRRVYDLAKEDGGHLFSKYKFNMWRALTIEQFMLSSSAIMQDLRDLFAYVIIKGGSGAGIEPEIPKISIWYSEPLTNPSRRRRSPPTCRRRNLSSTPTHRLQPRASSARVLRAGSAARPAHLLDLS